MSERDCAQLRSGLGPYLLGRASPAEAAELEAHLPHCPGCAAELEELRPVVTLLGTVDPDVGELVPPGPPPRLRDDVLTALRAERAAAPVALPRQRRTRLLVGVGAAAACLVAALALVLPQMGGGGPERVQLTAVGGASVSGSAQVAQHDGTTTITVAARGMTLHRTYGFWLQRPDGTRVPAGTWTAYDTDCHVTLQVRMRVRDASAVGFTTLDDHRDVAVGAL
ncbi:anti-sigma factor [Motilibacter rhizosphaerae]|nr:anti-sigma factor [Motilibacter rhizosphaerae]